MGRLFALFLWTFINKSRSNRKKRDEEKGFVWVNGEGGRNWERRIGGRTQMRWRKAGEEEEKEEKVEEVAKVEKLLNLPWDVWCTGCSSLGWQSLRSWQQCRCNLRPVGFWSPTERMSSLSDRGGGGSWWTFSSSLFFVHSSKSLCCSPCQSNRWLPPTRLISMKSRTRSLDHMSNDWKSSFAVEPHLLPIISQIQWVILWLADLSREMGAGLWPVWGSPADWGGASSLSCGNSDSAVPAQLPCHTGPCSRHVHLPQVHVFIVGLQFNCFWSLWGFLPTFLFHSHSSEDARGWINSGKIL